MADVQPLLDKLYWVVFVAAAAVFEPGSPDTVSLFQDDVYVSGMSQAEVASVDRLGAGVEGLASPSSDGSRGVHQ